MLLRERAAANSRHGLLDALACWTPDMARLDRESPAFARQHRRIAEKRRDARSIERRRHDDEAQILAQPRLRIERERKTEIRIERAFMEFIEDHRGDIGERRILENEAGEHALGHNLEAGIAREARTEPHAKPDRPADLFAVALTPCGLRRRAPRAGAAREEECGGPSPKALREARTARPSSSPLRSARRSRRWGANATPPGFQAGAPRSGAAYPRSREWLSGPGARRAAALLVPHFRPFPRKRESRLATGAKSAGPRLPGDERGQTTSACCVSLTASRLRASCSNRPDGRGSSAPSPPPRSSCRANRAAP